MIAMAQSWEIAMVLDQVPHRSFTLGSSGSKSCGVSSIYKSDYVPFPGVPESCPSLLYPYKYALHKSFPLLTKKHTEFWNKNEYAF